MISLQQYPSRSYLLALVGSAALALLFFVGLPAWGIDFFAEKMSAKMVVFGVIATFGLLAFIPYSQWLARHREGALIAFILLNPWIAELVNKSTKMGFPLSHTVILTGLFLVPFVVDALPNLGKILRNPVVTTFLFYVVLVTAYLLFYNIPTVEISNALAGKKSTNEMHFANCVVFLITIVMTTNVLLKSHSVKHFFDKINFWLAIQGILLGVGTIVSYALNYNVAVVEGFRRSIFLMGFAGPYSTFLTFNILYLMGVFFYYKSLSQRIPTLYLTSIFCLIAALLCTFTKSGYVVVAGGTLLLIVLNALHKKNWFTTLTSIFLFASVLLGSTFILDQVSDTKVLETIENRFSDANSLNWRYRVWSYLSEDIDPVGNFWGNGFYAHAAKMKLFEGINTYKTGERFQVTAVHNDFISHLYDMGPLGLIVFFMLAWIALKRLLQLVTRQLHHPITRELSATLVVLTLAFFIDCYVDNTFLMMESPFWLLFTILYMLTSPLQPRFLQEHAQEHTNVPT